MSHVEKQPKNDIPQNQDLTPPNSSLVMVQNLSFKYKIIIIKRLNVNSKKKLLNNFISYLSFLKKLCPTHTHPLTSICKFSKPYKLLFIEFESFLKYDVISMAGWVMLELSAVSYIGVGWVMQKNNPKNDSPWNQELTPPKSSLEGVQDPSFEYKNNYHYNFIISIVLYSKLY